MTLTCDQGKGHLTDSKSNEAWVKLPGLIITFAHSHVEQGNPIVHKLDRS